MSPLMLLLVEIGLVLATGYLFWLNRRQMAILRAAATPHSADGAPSDRAAQVDMMHDLADVLGEVRSAVEDMRAEWQRERDALRYQLEQAEKTIAEMRAQMNQARTLTPQGFSTLPVPEQACRPAQLGAPASDGASIRLDRAIERFTDHLIQSGLSERSVKRISASVREFAGWFGGQCYASLSADAIEHSHIERYIQQWQRRRLRPSTIRRKAATVRRFLAWRDAQPRTTVTEVGVRALRPVATAPRPAPSLVEPMTVADRRAAVFDLAEQGLDTSLIAARLGLERDTVRMLLSATSGRRPANGFPDRLTLGLGASYSARTPHVVHSPLA